MPSVQTLENPQQNKHHEFPGSLLKGVGGPPPYAMENKWRLYITCQQLSRTGAVTSQGSEGEALLYGKHQSG
ncbi:hypothetical protein CHARACLAT_017577 [Characodon lateralis]|uniref:Uncharacterized protein n=1 Tax=Characodon lateralis TaxID=208331 RepID=A0ABU7D0R1_9TELE|nr:hypothetical protein [Characodon lateralis]